MPKMADEPRNLEVPPTPGDERKAELRSRLFVSKANAKELPLPPPPPPKPNPKKDAPLLGYIAGCFLLLGIASMLLSRFVPGNGERLNPLEALGVLSFSAAGVMGVWAWYKSTGIDLSPREPDEFDGQ